jgi:hypothetical protein
LARFIFAFHPWVKHGFREKVLKTIGCGEPEGKASAVFRGQPGYSMVIWKET